MINDIRYDPTLALKRWVGYFDLLGMKDLYKSGTHISIFVALSNAIEKFQDRVTAWPNVGYVWFSDTFVVYTGDDSAESFGAIDSISEWFCYFLIWANIPVRGAISCDVLYADREYDLFFGEGLVEAYEYGEAQDWIGLVLCPSATERLKHLGLPPEERLYYTYAEIPFSKRPKELVRKLPACIIGNWVGKSPNDQNPIIEKLNQMKERVIDEVIRSKYDRTIKFLNDNKRFVVSNSNR
jgi:hypothetical protein